LSANKKHGGASKLNDLMSKRITKDQRRDAREKEASKRVKGNKKKIFEDSKNEMLR